MLQATIPHEQCYAGVLVSDRVTCTLANLEGKALKYVRGNAKQVQRMLDRLHMAMIQAGFLHLDIKPANIGRMFSADHGKLKLFFLDFGKVMRAYALPNSIICQSHNSKN